MKKFSESTTADNFFGPAKFDRKRYPMTFSSKEENGLIIYQYTNLEYERELVLRATVKVKKEHDPYFFPDKGLRSLQNRHTASYIELDGQIVKNFLEVA